MMKKSVNIIFFCLFFLLGLQCIACNKKNSSLPNFKVNSCSATSIFKSISKPEKSATFSTLDKLHKKKRFSRTHHNAIANLSKCNSLDLGFGTFFTSRFLFLDNSKLHKDFSDYTFNNSFCHRKLLSIFYSFQAFW